MNAANASTDVASNEQSVVSRPMSPLEKLDLFFSKAKSSSDPLTRILWFLQCKSVCEESGLHSLTGDYIGLVGQEKDKLNQEIKRENRQRKKDGQEPRPLHPINTWGGANDVDPRRIRS